MREADVIKERVRQAVNIVDVVAEHVTLRPVGKDFRGLCPFHEDRRPSLTVSPAKQIFKCFSCGAGGDVFGFVQRRENVTFPEAVTILAERAGIRWEAPSHRSSGSGPDRTALASVNAWARDHFRSRLYETGTGKEARKYLKGRGLSEAMWEAFFLGLAVDSYEDLLRAGRGQGFEEKLLAAAGLVRQRQEGGCYDTFRGRLMFPIAEATGRTIGFGGRTLGDDPAKYLNTPETLLFDKGRNLYGMDRAHRCIGQRGRAIVVEGYTDCVMAHQFDFEETVATLGTAMTEGHCRLLRRYTEDVVLVFDSDEAGRKAADRALSAAIDGQLSVRIASVPEGQDPCGYLLSAGPEAFGTVIDSATDAFEFKWRQIYEGHRAGESPRAKRAAIDSFLDTLLAANRFGAMDEIAMGLLLNRLSPLLGLPADALHQSIARRRVRRKRSAPTAGGSGAGAPNDRTRRGVSERAEERFSGDAEQAALQEILEVVINEPGLLGDVEEVFRPECFADEDLARIGRAVRALGERVGEFSLVELLDQFAEPRIADRITDLQAAGERCGRLDVRLEGAVETLKRVAQSRAAGAAARSLVEKDSEKIDGEAVDKALRALQAGAQKQHHFTPRRSMGYI